MLCILYVLVLLSAFTERKQRRLFPVCIFFCSLVFAPSMCKVEMLKEVIEIYHFKGISRGDRLYDYRAYIDHGLCNSRQQHVEGGLQCSFKANKYVMTSITDSNSCYNLGMGNKDQNYLKFFQMNGDTLYLAQCLSKCIRNGRHNT